MRQHKEIFKTKEILVKRRKEMEEIYNVRENNN